MRFFKLLLTLTLLVFLPCPSIKAQYNSTSSDKVDVTAPDEVFPAETGEPAQGSAPAESATVVDKIVKNIEIKGNKSISIAVILSKIKPRVGQPYLQNVMSDDLKRLYNTGYFSDVSVDKQDFEGGYKVIIILQEKLIVQEITFSKTRYIRAATILSKIKTQKGKFLDNKNLKDDVRVIQELYNQKGLTNVSVDVETVTDEANNKAQLHFVIKEGGRVLIKEIHVYGNKAYRQKKIISLIKTRAKFFLNTGYLKEDVLEEDMQRIASFYEREGYIDAKATNELEYLEGGKIILNIHVEEGKRYYIESITFQGNSVVSEAELKNIMKESVVEKPFSREKLTVDLSNIRTLYFDKGYIFANARESTSLNPDTGRVQVKIEISEGTQAYVNKIKIQGNTRTRDIVVRREIRLNPGDKFDGEKLRRSKERLRNLGYFEDINYDIEDTDTPDKKDLVVQVTEAKTGTLSFGGGYSSVDQIVGFVEIEQKNFDFTNWPTFTGAGQQLTLRAETGSTRNNTMLSFTEPWIFDYPVSGGFDIYRNERDRERDVGYAYDEKRVGGDVRFGKQFTEFISGDTYYKRENVDIGNLESNVSADLRSEEGESALSIVGFTLSRDGRDSTISPTKGLLVSGSADVAGGPLGGDKDFYRFQTRASYYVPLKFNSVLELRLRTGVANEFGDSDKVPIFERFFAGGARTIRGYNERKVG
ncbi:MAG: outer membrane protein assembly factor BamA, partial [Omnitrophica WOR_2 bacterium GWA2_47_8]